MNTVLIIILFSLVLTNVATLVLYIGYKKVAPSSAPNPEAQTEDSEAQVKLSEQKIAELESQTQAAFEGAVTRATDQFNQDIAGTSERLNSLVVRLTTGVIEDELLEYRKGLENARVAALSSLQEMQQTVDQQQQALQGDMVAAVQKRQQELISRMEGRLGTVVANYIVESLGQAVDLGAQRDYLLASLERNKDALKKDIAGEL